MNSTNALNFLMGLGIGAVAVVLYAPRSGSKTRDFLRNKSAEGVNYVRRSTSDAIHLARRKAEGITKIAA